MARISQILAYHAGTYGLLLADEVRVAGSNDLFPHLAAYPSTLWKLGEPARMTFELPAGSVWSQTLTTRTRLRVVYDDDSMTEWRVSEIKSQTSGEADTAVECEPIWLDLGSTIFRYLRAPGSKPDYAFPLYRLTFAQAAAIIFDTDYGVSSYFRLGTVVASLADKVVSFDVNASTHLDYVRLLCEAGDAEWDLRWDAGVSCWRVDFVVEVGYSAAELTAGASDPDSRPIDGPSAVGEGQGNRVELTIEDAQDDFFSRLIPLAGDEEAPVGIDGIWWKIAAVAENVPIGGETTITFVEDIVYYPSIPGGKLVLDDHATPFTIQETTEPNQVVILGLPSGVGSAPAAARFTTGEGVSKGSIGTNVSYVADLTAEAQRGRREVKRFFPEIPPYDNLVAEAGISADLSTWLSGSPVGYQNSSGLTVVSVTDPLYVRHGTASAKCTGGKGEWIRTDEITLSPTEQDPYASVAASLRVVTGRVQVTMVEYDGGGTIRHVWPDGAERTEAVADDTLVHRIGGMQPQAGPVRIVVTVMEDGTEFYLDALTLTQSVRPWDYAPAMGKRALYVAAVEYLQAHGGVQDSAFTTEWFDVAVYEEAGTWAETRLGSYVRLRDRYNSALSTWGIDVTGRIVELKETEDPVEGRLRKQARVARRRPSPSDRFVPAAPISNQPSAPPKVIEPGPAAVRRYGFTPGALPIAPFQEFVDNVGKRGGNTIMFDDGIYDVAPIDMLSSINLRPGVHLDGRSFHRNEVGGEYGTILRHTGPRETYIVSVGAGTTAPSDPDANVYDNVIRHILFRGQTESRAWQQTPGESSEHTHLVNLNGLSHALVEWCRFEAFEGDGVYVGSGNVGGHETHNRRIVLRHNWFDGINKENRNGISVIDGENVQIRYNFFRRCSRADMPGPIDVEPDAQAWHRIRQILIEGNDFEDCGGGAIVQIYLADWGVFTQEPRTFRVAKNDMRASPGSFGLQIFRDSDALASHDSLDFVIEGNTGEGLKRPFNLSGIKGLRSAFNTWRDIQGSGLIGFTGAASRDVSLLRDTFERVGTDTTGTQGNAAVVVYSAHGLQVESCLFDDCGYFEEGEDPFGLPIQFNAGSSSFVWLLRNTFRTRGRMTHGILASGHTFEARTNRYEGNAFDGYAAEVQFEYMLGDFAEGAMGDTSRLPDDYPVGITPETIAVDNSDPNIPAPVGYSGAKQGFRLTFVPRDVGVDPGFRKWIRQIYYPALNSGQDAIVYTRSGNELSNTWGSWHASNGSTAALGFLVDAVQVVGARKGAVGQLGDSVGGSVVATLPALPAITASPADTTAVATYINDELLPVLRNCLSSLRDKNNTIVQRLGRPESTGGHGLTAD